MNSSENIPEDLERDIPKVLPNITGKLRSKEEFVNLIVQLYKICTTREVNLSNGAVERSIHIKFIGYPANLAGIKRFIPDIKKANLTGLYRVLLTVEAASATYRLRHVAESCVAKGAFLLKAKQLFYWEVNFVYFLNLLPAANDTENVNEVSRVNVVS